jgi:hypothetical protein
MSSLVPLDLAYAVNLEVHAYSIRTCESYIGQAFHLPGALSLHAARSDAERGEAPCEFRIDT